MILEKQSLMSVPWKFLNSLAKENKYFAKQITFKYPISIEFPELKGFEMTRLFTDIRTLCSNMPFFLAH